MREKNLALLLVGCLVASAATASTVATSTDANRFEDYGARFTIASTCSAANVVDITDPSGPVTACDVLTADGTVSTPTSLTAGTLVVLQNGFNVDAGTTLSVGTDSSLFPDAYLQDDTPAGETTYAARFYMNPESLALDADTDRFYHFIAYDGNGDPVFRVGVTYDVGTTENRLFYEVIEDDGTVLTTEMTDELTLVESSNDPGGDCATETEDMDPLTGCYQRVEVGWVASSGPGADDGTAYLCLNGLEAGDCKNLADLNSDLQTVDTVRWGVMDVTDDLDGQIDVDQFESQRATLIGADPLESP